MTGSLLMSSWRQPRRYLTGVMLLWGAGAAPIALIGFPDRLRVMAAANVRGRLLRRAGAARGDRTPGVATAPRAEIAHPLDEPSADSAAAAAYAGPAWGAVAPLSQRRRVVEGGHSPPRHTSGSAKEGRAGGPGRPEGRQLRTA